jgi:hypothetical protein
MINTQFGILLYKYVLAISELAANPSEYTAREAARMAEEVRERGYADWEYLNDHNVRWARDLQTAHQTAIRSL